MLSRVANANFWMHRYLERSENYARFMDVNFNLSLELPPDIPEQWRPLVEATGDWELYKSLHGEESREKIIYFLGFDTENPNSLCNSITHARENARSIRPEITREMWEQINRLYFLTKEGHDKKIWKKQDPRDFFHLIKTGVHLIYGIFYTTIARDEGWHYGKMGQLIERADKTSRILDVKYHILLPTPKEVGSPIDLIQWVALLKSVSAFDMYRKKNGKLTSWGIVEYLILDREFPRAMLSCLINTEHSLHTLSGVTEGFSNLAEKKIGLLKSRLEYSDINDVFSVGVHEFLDTFQLQLNEVSSSIFAIQ